MPCAHRLATQHRIEKPVCGFTRAAVCPVFQADVAGEQQAIACSLGALDDKIELDWRMNETLEAMARAIFKSRFADLLCASQGVRVYAMTVTFAEPVVEEAALA
jgi:hypothetical protein